MIAQAPDPVTEESTEENENAINSSQTETVDHVECKAMIHALGTMGATNRYLVKVAEVLRERAIIQTKCSKSEWPIVFKVKFVSFIILSKEKKNFVDVSWFITIKQISNDFGGQKQCQKNKQKKKLIWN